MNMSDSERIHTVLKQSGFIHVQDVEDADLVIMNTCSVKQKAEDKVWGHIGKVAKMRRKKPSIRIGLTGCMVRESGTSTRYDTSFKSKDVLFSSTEDLDFVFRIEDLAEVPKYLSVIYDKDIGTDYPEELSSYFGVKPEYTKAFQVFVPIQTGCDKFCTYCIVPFTRKREISRPMAEILDEVKVLAKNGAKEVTLLGQTVNSYHDDTPHEYSEHPFAELLFQVNKIDGIERIRYTSPHPMDYHDDLIRAHVDLDKVCNHVHMPVQSGDNEVLRRMNRKYTREQYLEIIKKVKKSIPDVTITTDFIVGFCGETDAEFENSYDLFQEVGFDMSFTSRYSPRTGTYSARRMPDDVGVEVKAERWHRLNELLKETSLRRNKTHVGSIYTVLVEKKLPDGRYEGMTTTYKRVQFSGKGVEIIGTIVPVKISKAVEFFLHGDQL